MTTVQGRSALRADPAWPGRTWFGEGSAGLGNARAPGRPGVSPAGTLLHAPRAVLGLRDGGIGAARVRPDGERRSPDRTVPGNLVRAGARRAGPDRAAGPLRGAPHAAGAVPDRGRRVRRSGGARAHRVASGGA